MKFVNDIKRDKFEEFVKSNEKSHFLQSYSWGEFAKKEKNLIPYYVGLEDDNNNLVATALILKKRLPLGLSYFYIPRGFIIDYKNYDLLKEFTGELKRFSKANKAIFFKIDPDIIYNITDTNQNKVIENNKEEINNLKKLGYKHLGFTKNFETMQPRYTFRIDMNKEYEEIVNNFSKTTKQRIKKSEDLGIEVRIGTKDDIKTFYELMLITENRKDFITHNESYYKSLYEIWNKHDKCYLFIGSVDLDKIIDIQSKLLSELEMQLEPLKIEDLSKSKKVQKRELETRIEKLNNEIDKYKNIIEEYGSKIVLNGHFIIIYDNKAWVLYAGNHNILTDTYSNYQTYKEHIKYCYENNIKIYDQFGTIGDLRKDNPLIGLHEFKKKFGGDYIEFIGEFDYIIHPFMYFVFTKLVPIYRNCIKMIAKKKRGQK